VSRVRKARTSVTSASPAADEPQRDIIFFLADGGMEKVITAFLTADQFHRKLGCGPFMFDPGLDIIVCPTHDPGTWKMAREFLQPFERTRRHAVVVIDNDWTGSPGVEAIREDISKTLRDSWAEFAVIVIDPELEAWVMSENAHLARLFRAPENYREILQRETEWWPEEKAKPTRPKEALKYLKMHHNTRATYADFGRLVCAMSVKNCIDLAFNELRDTLRAWFPEQP
jgi:hypothetical protein